MTSNNWTSNNWWQTFLLSISLACLLTCSAAQVLPPIYFIQDDWYPTAAHTRKLSDKNDTTKVHKRHDNYEDQKGFIVVVGRHTTSVPPVLELVNPVYVQPHFSVLSAIPSSPPR
eukprot:GHVS01003421.1.p1 GENE.GHVS01003421.1~~GHVS01003421.1.p1  ORF type:complete len:115 (+),score=13.39 GHVS01003421.1:133-477(+)